MTLEEERKRAGLTQTELAKLAGITQATISRLEHAHHIPSLDTCQRICLALSIRRVEQIAWPSAVAGESEPVVRWSPSARTARAARPNVRAGV